MKNIREIIQSSFNDQYKMIDELIKDDQINDIELNQWSSRSFSFCIKDCNEGLEISDSELQKLIENEFNFDLKRLNKRIQQVWG